MAEGFRFQPDPGAPTTLAVVTEEDLFGSRRHTRTAPRGTARRADALAVELEPGELAVHQVHGVGRYVGMVRRAVAGSERDYLLLEYAQGDKLYVPSDQVGIVAKYVGRRGPAPAPPGLERLGEGHRPRPPGGPGHGGRAGSAVLGAHVGARACVRPGHALAAGAGGGVPVRRDPRPADGHRRGQAGHGAGATHGPAPVRRRRLRQDRDRGAGGVQGGAGREAGRGAGADHAARRTAPGDVRGTLRPVPGQREDALAVRVHHGAAGGPR